MSYQLEASQTVKARVRLLADSALAQRQALRFSNAFSEIIRALVDSPTSFGEPLRDYAALNLVEYHASLDAIQVRYCVDDTSRTVYLQAVKFMPNSGLSELP